MIYFLVFAMLFWFTCMVNILFSAAHRVKTHTWGPSVLKMSPLSPSFSMSKLPLSGAKQPETFYGFTSFQSMGSPASSGMTRNWFYWSHSLIHIKENKSNSISSKVFPFNPSSVCINEFRTHSSHVCLKKCQSRGIMYIIYIRFYYII